ncbi:hypothetical protein NP945_10680 [Mesorhizobium sp. LMG17149]|uniref:hypothetical protein n=1 Tax=Mesorhizobium sp. LMG17149 TaxID=2968497 RepID=UPI002117782E|nr:hypothetical protein [Mesorhizobium sp. LMG17149]MCQ8872284.1 hypothetical protein [Mesorhizobium sp. LMG17149]
MKSEDALQQSGSFFEMLFLRGLHPLGAKTVSRLAMCRSRGTEIQHCVSGNCDKPLQMHQTLPPLRTRSLESQANT